MGAEARSEYRLVGSWDGNKHVLTKLCVEGVDCAFVNADGRRDLVLPIQPNKVELLIAKVKQPLGILHAFFRGFSLAYHHHHPALNLFLGP